MEKVCGFTGEYDFLSNDYPCKIFCPEDGLTYSNVSTALIADEILYHLLYIKFSTNNKLKEKLLNTNNKELLNIVSYPDTEYGIYLGNGNNTLGKMLMTLRSELSAGTTKKVVNKVINKVKSMI